MINKPGISYREDRYLQLIADRTPTRIRITRAVLAPLGGRVQPVRPGVEIILPRDVAVQIVEAGKAELI